MTSSSNGIAVNLLWKVRYNDQIRDSPDRSSPCPLHLESQLLPGPGARSIRPNDVFRPDEFLGIVLMAQTQNTGMTVWIIQRVFIDDQ